MLIKWLNRNIRVKGGLGGWGVEGKLREERILKSREDSVILCKEIKVSIWIVLVVVVGGYWWYLRG